MSVRRVDGLLYAGELFMGQAQVDVVAVNKPEELAPGKKVLLLGTPREIVPTPEPREL